VPTKIIVHLLLSFVRCCLHLPNRYCDFAFQIDWSLALVTVAKHVTQRSVIVVLHHTLLGSEVVSHMCMIATPPQKETYPPPKKTTYPSMLFAVCRQLPSDATDMLLEALRDCSVLQNGSQVASVGDSSLTQMCHQAPPPLSSLRRQLP